MVLHPVFCFTLLLVMCYRMCDLARDNFTNGVRRDGTSDMVCFCGNIARIAFVCSFCHLLSLGHETTLGWLHHPEGSVFDKAGGFIPQKGWLYPLKRVDFPPKGAVGFFESVHKTTQGGFKGGFNPHVGVVLCLVPGGEPSVVPVGSHRLRFYAPYSVANRNGVVLGAL